MGFGWVVRGGSLCLLWEGVCWSCCGVFCCVVVVFVWIDGLFWMCWIMCVRIFVVIVWVCWLFVFFWFVFGCLWLVCGFVGEGEGCIDVFVGVCMVLGVFGEVLIWWVMLVFCVFGVFFVLWRLLVNMCGKNFGCCCCF